MPRAPRDWYGFYGATDIVKLLNDLCRGSRILGEPLCNLRIVGLPGIGKTHLARSLAKAMGVNYYVVDASGKITVEQISDVAQRLNAGDIFHIDEAHALDVKVQDVLLGISGEDRKLRRDGVPIGKKTADNFISVASFTLILTTNLPGHLRKALKDRTKKIEIDPYPTKEMRQIVRHILSEKGLRAKNQVLTHFARASRGIPRRAKKLIDDAYKCFPYIESDFTTSDFNLLMQKLGYYFDKDFVLKKDEQKYLRILRKHDKPVPVGYLVDKFNSTRQLLREEIEFHLIEDGLVQFEQRGRVLTPKGRELVRRLFKNDIGERTETEVE